MYNIIFSGTRSKRRGLDETGACANYVETEQVCVFIFITRNKAIFPVKYNIKSHNKTINGTCRKWS